MKTKLFLVTAIVLTSLLAGTSVKAQEMPPSHKFNRQNQSPEDQDKIKQEIDQAIGITPDQKEKMEAIRKDLANKQKTLTKELKANQEALRVILDSDHPERAQAEAVANAINSLQNTRMKNHIDFIFQVRTILTPEQYKKLEAFRKQHYKERKNKRQPGRQRAQ